MGKICALFGSGGVTVGMVKLGVVVVVKRSASSAVDWEARRQTQHVVVQSISADNIDTLRSSNKTNYHSLQYIIRFIAHHVQDGYTLVENTLMTIKKPLGEKGITEQMGHRN